MNMNEAQRIVTEFLEGFNIKATSRNVMYLFNADYEMEFDTEAKYDSVDKAFTRIEIEGGEEGEGEYCYGVIRISNTYLKAEWSYYSQSGCEYDSIFNTLKVVIPEQKTITVYN